MGEKFIDSTLLDKAVIFAVKAHSNTERRGKGVPYIVHPLEAVSIAATMTTDQVILAAAALHDVVEDTAVTIGEIEREFGPRVASLVKDETDCETPGGSKSETWHMRKQAAITRLEKVSREAKIVALSDKLSNMRAIAADYAKLGDGLWSRFHTSDPKEHEWHYRGLAASLSDLSDTDAYKEFLNLISSIFNQVSVIR